MAVDDNFAPIVLHGPIDVSHEPDGAVVLCVVHLARALHAFEGVVAQVVPRQNRVRPKTIDLGAVPGHSTRACVTSVRRSQRFDSPWRAVETCYSSAWPCATSWAFSPAPTDDFAHLTACCG